MVVNSNHTTSNRAAVVVYFLLATLISLVFRIYMPSRLDLLKLPYGYGLNILVGAGPLLAAEITRKLFDNADRRLPLYSDSLSKSLLFMLAPAFVLLIIGVKNKQHQNEHLFAVQVCLLWFVYIFGEESGWRGYLQQILNVSDYKKALIVGLQWYLWHLSFLFERTSLIKELVFLVVLLTGSFLAIKITKRTNSLLPAIGLHFSFSVITNVPNPSHYLTGVVAMLVTWGILLWKWSVKNESISG
ncbi:MAG: CPBP family intramembrane metalloprotease [Sphingobacteriaceae bacterium]|nr:MAG: CPBP family intramembrane metalloprotease [Sphingobacteriaceae bacterium]